MAVKGSWSDQVLVQSQVELVYNPLMGALNDNLILPNTDSPIQKIELLEIRLDSPVPVGILNIGFKNKNIPIKDGQYSSRTHISVHNISPSDPTVFGNEYSQPPMLYRSLQPGKRDSCSEFRLNIFTGTSTVAPTPTLCYLRLRVSRYALAGTEIDMKHEPQILMV